MIPHHTVTGPHDAPVLVLSNSLGTTLEMWDAQAQALAERFRLVLLCTSPRLGPAETWRERSATVREHGTQAIVDATMERWLTEDYRATHDISALVEMFNGIDDEGYANCCAIIERMDQTAGLAQIDAPTLVIGGAQDPSTPPAEHAARIAAAIPGARLEVLDPGAHLINVERPDEVTALIAGHLEG